LNKFVVGDTSLNSVTVSAESLNTTESPEGTVGIVYWNISVYCATHCLQA